MGKIMPNFSKPTKEITELELENLLMDNPKYQNWLNVKNMKKEEILDRNQFRSKLIIKNTGDLGV